MTFEDKFIETARRREIAVNTEAALHGISLEDARKIIRRLLRDGRIYQSSKPRSRRFCGSTYAGYTAIDRPSQV